MTMQDIVAATSHRPAPLHLVSPQVRAWLMLCLAKQVANRPRVPQIKDMPWLRGLPSSAPATWSKNGQHFLVPSTSASAAIPSTAVLPPPAPTASVSVPAGGGIARSLSPLRIRQEKPVVARPPSPVRTRTVMRQVSRQVSPLRSRSPHPVNRSSLAALGMPVAVALASTEMEGSRPCGLPQSTSLPPPLRTSPAWPPVFNYSGAVQPASPYVAARTSGISPSIPRHAWPREAPGQPVTSGFSNPYASPVLSNR